MAALPIILGGAAAITQAMGAIQQGEAEAAASEYNAKLLEQNATQSRQQAAEEERRQRIFARKYLGSIRANTAASGLNLEGSALDVLEESAEMAELDALTIRHQGDTRAIGYQNEARLERFRAKNARTGSRYRAAGYLLEGGTRLAGAAGVSGGAA